mgnify:FL=1
MFFRILYVIVSFSPFFFILGIVETLNILSITINGKEIAKVENLQYILIAIYFIIPIISIIDMYRHLNRQQKKANGNRSTSPIKTKTMIQDREISKNFLLSFVLPLISMNISIQTWNQRIVIWIILIVILSIFTYSKKFDFNIIFLFTKYRKYLIDNNIIVIMSREYETNLSEVLEKYEFIKMQQSEVYLLNEETVILGK